MAAPQAVTPKVAAAPMAIDLNSTDDEDDEPAPAPVRAHAPAPAPALTPVAAPVPAAAPVEQTESDTEGEDGAVTEAWPGPPAAEVRPEAEPASPRVFVTPLDTRPRRSAASTSPEGQAWRIKDAQVLEDIKEREQDVWVTAGGAAGALERDHGESDLEDGAECDPDDDYVSGRHVRTPRAPKRKPKRPRTVTDTTPAVAAPPAVADDVEMKTQSTDAAGEPSDPAPAAMLPLGAIGSCNRPIDLCSDSK